MSHQGTEDKFLTTLYPKDITDLPILDVGHGYGKTGWYIRSFIGMQRGWCRLYGIEIFPEYHELAKRMGYYDDLVLGDAAHADTWKDYRANYFSVSIAQHVVEHMKMEHAIRMIRFMEYYTYGTVIITTPNGYTESGPLDGNEANKHLSGWTEEDFHKLGYKTKICSKNVNSRLLMRFAQTVFRLQGKKWENEVIVAWKTM